MCTYLLNSKYFIQVRFVICRDILELNLVFEEKEKQLLDKPSKLTDSVLMKNIISDSVKLE